MRADGSTPRSELPVDGVVLWSRGHRRDGASGRAAAGAESGGAWKLIDENPAEHGVPNPARRCREQRPLDSWEQIGSVAELLRPTFGFMVMFAAATGLRPSELFAFEHGDVDRPSGVIHVRRAYANGRVKHPKTRLSRRAAASAGNRGQGRLSDDLGTAPIGGAHPGPDG
jgi:integrase